MSEARRQLGLIGWPVAHSYSPAMQEAALTALGLPWRYGAFPVRPVRLADAIRGAAALGFVGLNVTVPHKEGALALSAPDPLASDVGAVNTLVFRDGEPRPAGLNTDVHGFRMLLRETGADALVRDRLVVVLGAGGAARAAVRALLDDGAGEVAVLTRSARRVELREPDARLTHSAWTLDALSEHLARAHLLVDATPRGLAPGEPAIALDRLPREAAVLDLVVRPTTPLIDEARRCGVARAHTGERMLLHQGAAALQAWTGRAAPIEVMRAALAAAMQQSTAG